MYSGLENRKYGRMDPSRWPRGLWICRQELWPLDHRDGHFEARPDKFSRQNI
jgi:hypothetical protein